MLHYYSNCLIPSIPQLSTQRVLASSTWQGCSHSGPSHSISYTIREESVPTVPATLTCFIFWFNYTHVHTTCYFGHTSPPLSHSFLVLNFGMRDSYVACIPEYISSTVRTSSSFVASLLVSFLVTLHCLTHLYFFFCNMNEMSNVMVLAAYQA